jgi:hypothetical protein
MSIFAWRYFERFERLWPERYQFGALLPITAIVLTLIGCADRTTSPARLTTKIQIYSTRNAATAVLHPSQASFAIPLEWLKYYEKNGDNLHLSREELKECEFSNHIEFDAEYARACNAALPFDRCALQIGSEGWGERGHSFDDLQVRVYDIPKTDARIEPLVDETVRSIVHPARVILDPKERWSRICFIYDRTYFDYSATAYIDIRIRRFEDREFVFVFMYTDEEKWKESIDEMLRSFLY